MIDKKTLLGGGFLDSTLVVWIKNGRYSVFQSPDVDDEIQILIENTTVTIFIQIVECDITVIFEWVNGDMVI